MIISLVLIEGTDLDEQDLGISLGNAKQIVVGRAYGFGIILHIAATTPATIAVVRSNATVAAIVTTY